MSTESRELYDRYEVLGEMVYYQSLGDPFCHPSVGRQLRESLARQRRAGVGFDLAWRQAVGHLMFDHDRESREQWRALIASPDFRELWRAAFEGDRAHRLLNGASLLRLALDDAAERGARRRRAAAGQPAARDRDTD
jgi:hypothetical protein